MCWTFAWLHLALPFHLEHQIQRKLSWFIGWGWVLSERYLAALNVFDQGLSDRMSCAHRFVFYEYKILMSLFDEWNWRNICILHQSFDEEEALHRTCNCIGAFISSFWIYSLNLWETTFSRFWLKLQLDCEFILGYLDYNDNCWLWWFLPQIKCREICWNLNRVLGSTLCLSLCCFIDKSSWFLRRWREILLLASKIEVQRCSKSRSCKCSGKCL